MVQFRCCAIMMLLFVISHKDNSDADEPIFIESSSESVEADWAQFRGAGGRGISLAEGPLPTLESLEKELAWKVKVPAGHSSPILVGECVYLTSFSEGLLSVHCIDLRDGHETWRRDEAVRTVESFHPQHGPASCTPVSDGKRLYVVFGSIGVVCYDLEGKELWRQPWELKPNLFGSPLRRRSFIATD